MLDAVVVGAGPYGLSIAAHLRGRGKKFRIFGELMHSWAECMPKGMDLKSDHFASNISDPAKRYSLVTFYKETGREYQKFGGAPVPLSTFVEYGQWFQKNAVPELEQTLVTNVDEIDGGYEVTLATGEKVQTREVILAVGVTHFRYVPENLRHLGAKLTHTAEHKEPANLKGKDVLIVGRGASAIDLAMLAHEAGANVQVVARKNHIEFHNKQRTKRPLADRLRRPMSTLGAGWKNLALAEMPIAFHMLPEPMRMKIARTFLGPAPGWSVKARVEGKFPMHLGYDIEKAEIEGDKVKVSLIGKSQTECKTLTVDHVVAATGYKVDTSRLKFLSEDLRKKIVTNKAGAPVLTTRFESTAKGLYFTGLSAANTFGPLMRFAAGATFTAGHVAGAIAHRHASASSDLRAA